MWCGRPSTWNTFHIMICLLLAVSSHASRTTGEQAMRTKLLTITALAASAVIAAAFFVQPAKAAERQPNIVFMLVDNLGYGELGVYGGGLLPRGPPPRLEQHATEG